MNIVYLDNAPFGSFYYNPESHLGVVVPKFIEKVGAYIRPFVLSMKDTYNPFKDPHAVTLSVEPEVFEKLKEAASQHDQDAVNSVLMEYLSTP